MRAEQHTKGEDGSSFSNIYRVLHVLGSASVVTTALSLLRNKAFALLLGPTGFGTLTLFNSVISVAGNLGGMGIGYSATRIISAAHGRNRRRQAAVATHAFTSVAMKLALTAALATSIVLGFWSASDASSPFDALAIGAIALGAGFSILASVNTTLLQVRRDPARLAFVAISAAVVHTAVAIWLASQWATGVVSAIAAALPFSLWLVSEATLRRLGRYRAPRSAHDGSLQGLIVRRGLSLMVPGVMESSSALLVRAAGVATIGLAAVGHVFAAFAISSFVLSAVMTAMNQDFYPRVCEAAGRKSLMYRLASEQLRVTIQLSAPILLLLTTFAAEIVRVLFSPEFAESARLIPLMAFLVITSVAVWPLHTLQSALGLPRQQAAGSVANAVVTLLVIGALRSDLAPMSFAAAMAVGGLAQVALQSALLRARAGIVYQAADWGPMALLVATIAGIAFLGAKAPDATKVAGTLMAGAWAYVALMHYRRHRS